MDFNFNSWIITNELSNINSEILDDIIEKIIFITTDESIMSFLLDKNNINSIVEKLVLDIVTFHLNRLNILFNEEIFIEFWFKKYNNSCKTNFHIDCDEYDRVINKCENYNTPILSCITYLNHNDNSATIITNIDKESYKNNNFYNKKICISLPRKMKHITFNGGNYHSESKLYLIENIIRNILVINIWNKKPLHVPIFNYEYFFFTYTMNIKKELKTLLFDSNETVFNINEIIDKTIEIKITDDNYILSQTFFEKLLYENSTNCFILKDIIDKINVNNLYDTFIFEKYAIENDVFKKNDINSLLDVSNIPKFNQRFIINKHFTKDICKWIIYEAESYALKNSGWITKRHDNYPTTDLNIDLIPSVFSFILTSFNETISKEIIKNYSLNEEKYTFEITDIFIVKYEMNKQTFLEIHDDLCCLRVNILLSDITEFKGGGTLFEDGITMYLNQGDMIIHSGKSKHAGIEITEGKRYVLVFFINLFNI